jgi:hypothetical protein
MITGSMTTASQVKVAYSFATPPISQLLGCDGAVILL